MTLKTPLTSFGIHQCTITDPVTKEMSTMKVVGSAAYDASQAPVPLYGGSMAFPQDVQHGVAASTINLTVKQYDAKIMEYFTPYSAGGIVENISGDALGAVSGLENVVGTSFVDATTGVASVAVTLGVNPVYGRYIMEAITETTVDVYIDNDIDGITIINSNLKITATPITIPGTDGTVAESASGVTFTGGAGAIALVVGDKAAMNVIPTNAYNFSSKFGVSGEYFKEFELVVLGEKVRGNIYSATRYYRVVANGVPINNPEKDWATFDVTLTALYSTSQNAVGVTSLAEIRSAG
jgi:hypothetical protein